MTDFKIRTENIKPTKILDYFVETSNDRKIIDRLKSDSPIILIGSRGVGKSFLMRVAEAELRETFQSKRVLPVYISFTQGSVLQLAEEALFYHWMLARICSALIRSLKKNGIVTPNVIIGAADSDDDEGYLDKLIKEFEGTWDSSIKHDVDISKLPTVDTFKEYIEDICEEAEIDSINIYIDEAAHILRPSQQRQFFSLYRDINSPYLNCSAAVYPGVTSFGNYFQPIHDAVFIDLDRDPKASGYVDLMRNIVEKQADSTQMAHIIRNGENFSVLAYAANGNPRLLLKTLTRAPAVSSREVDNVIKEFYKNDIWEEHSLLAEKYAGFSGFIEWGRKFLEDEVLPEIKKKNDNYLKSDRKTTSFFWIHKNAPEPIKKALALLCYTGIITLHSDAMKATRAEIGSRYSVNLGCLFSLESRPSATSSKIAKSTTIKRMSEYGAHHSSYNSIECDFNDFDDEVISEALETQLDKSVKLLDLPQWLIDSLLDISLSTIRDVLSASEKTIQRAYYVGEVRSRYIKNEATSAVFEYLSG
jgi:hypothetical protein